MFYYLNPRLTAGSFAIKHLTLHLHWDTYDFNIPNDGEPQLIPFLYISGDRRKHDNSNSDVMISSQWWCCLSGLIEDAVHIQIWMDLWLYFQHIPPLNTSCKIQA